MTPDAADAGQAIASRLAMRLRSTIGPLVLSDRIGRAASSLLGGRIPHRGLTIDTRSPLISDDVRTALLMRAYESAEQRFVRRYIPTRCNVIELGASIGVMTCRLRRQIAAPWRLMSVEADARLLPLVEANLAANGCGQVELTNEAIGYTDTGFFDFALGDNNLGGSIGASRGKATRVPAVRLHELVERLGPGPYAIVSDIEGAEWQVWSADRASLRGATMCVVELHDAGDGRPAADLLREIACDDAFDVLDRYGNVVVFRGRAAA